MIDLVTVFWLAAYSLGCILIFGLLYWLVGWIGGQFAEYPSIAPYIGLWVKVFRIILVVVGVLVLIGLIVNLMGGPQVFRWGHGL